MTSKIEQQKANGNGGRFGHLQTQESAATLEATPAQPAPGHRHTRRGQGEQDQTNRWRCTVTGCNPVLIGEDVAKQHVEETGHRTAKWPIRSKAGKAKAKSRNRNGYYTKYNVAAALSSAAAYSASEPRGHWYDDEDFLDEDVHPFSDEAFG